MRLGPCTDPGSLAFRVDSRIPCGLASLAECFARGSSKPALHSLRWLPSASHRPVRRLRFRWCAVPESPMFGLMSRIVPIEPHPLAPSFEHLLSICFYSTCCRRIHDSFVSKSVSWESFASTRDLCCEHVSSSRPLSSRLYGWPSWRWEAFSGFCERNPRWLNTEYP